MDIAAVVLVFLIAIFLRIFSGPQTAPIAEHLRMPSEEELRSVGMGRIYFANYYIRSCPARRGAWGETLAAYEQRVLRNFYRDYPRLLEAQRRENSCN